MSIRTELGVLRDLYRIHRRKPWPYTRRQSVRLTCWWMWRRWADVPEEETP